MTLLIFLFGDFIFLSDFINFDNLELEFNIIKFEGVNLLITENHPSNNYLQELHALVKDVLTAFRDNSFYFSNENILGTHPGGKQVYIVFECLLRGRKVAVKIYKPIITHLIVHTVATKYILENAQEFDKSLTKFSINLAVPQTIALGHPTTDNFVPPISILIQEWIGNSIEIHRVFPRDHVNIIRTIIKKLTSEKGFMVDIMSKNWLMTENNKIMSYIDLILFNPTGSILEKIKNWTKKLE